jgi:hypothetical protein
MPWITVCVLSCGESLFNLEPRDSTLVHTSFGQPGSSWSGRALLVNGWLSSIPCPFPRVPAQCACCCGQSQTPEMLDGLPVCHAVTACWCSYKQALMTDAYCHEAFTALIEVCKVACLAVSLQHSSTQAVCCLALFTAYVMAMHAGTLVDF